jgi:predicted ArsR family transcriptional regulator
VKMTLYRDHIAQVSDALADPTRREIMEFVYEADDALSVREVAEHFGLHVNAARMHLDKLVKGGILGVMRRRGRMGGRPAHLYRASEKELELHLPPRRYKLLAEVLVQALPDLEIEPPTPVGERAFSAGREEAVRSSSSLAYLSPDTGAAEVALAWSEEIKGRGCRARIEESGESGVAVVFLSCPFGDLSNRSPRLVCEIHRRFEEGHLSLAGDWTLRGGLETGCAFYLKPSSPKA